MIRIFCGGIQSVATKEWLSSLREGWDGKRCGGRFGAHDVWVGRDAASNTVRSFRPYIFTERLDGFL